MTNPSPWNPQTPVARSAVPHPARLGKRKKGCPGGHATRRGASIARSAGTPRAFAERYGPHGWRRCYRKAA